MTESIPSGALKVAELLSCPFCGESNARVDDVGEMPLGRGQWQPLSAVHCRCGVEGTTCNTPAFAIEAWNRRASPSPATGALSDERIAELNRAAQDQSIRGIAPSLHLARAVEAEVRAALSSAKREAEPLTETQIKELCSRARAETWGREWLAFARAIEAAHGITAASQVEPEEKHG